jgi:hypothetical protein
MTKEELAVTLHGRQIGRELAGGIATEAKDAGLVVVYGASDDLMEFSGAIEDERGVGEYEEVFFTKEGFFDEQACDDKCKYFELARQTFEKNASRIEVFWDSQGYSWAYETEIPHATFDIFEDGEKYCRGIVFSLADVK